MDDRDDRGQAHEPHEPHESHESHEPRPRPQPQRPHLWPATYPELARKVSSRIAAHRHHDAPNEAVGIIFADGSTYILPNVAEDPLHEFLIDPREISLAIASKGVRPVALYHTHWETDATPSVADGKQLQRLAADNDHPVMFIHGKDGLRAWTWEDGGDGGDGEDSADGGNVKEVDLT